VSRLWHWGDDPGVLVEVLSRGGILAIPTESSYGLAADPRSAPGVAAVYRVKGRENSKPLPVVTAGVEQIRKLGADSSVAERLGLLALWPAALTLVLPIRRPLPAAAGGSTLGFRVPAHALLRELLASLGHGLTATSANRSGEAPVLDPEALAPLLVRSDAVIVDDGVLAGGLPSTVVEVGETGWRVLRQGSVHLESDPLPSPPDGAADL